MSHETQAFLIFPPDYHPIATAHLKECNIHREKSMDLRISHLIPNLKHLIEATTAIGAQIIKKHFGDELADIWREDGFPVPPAISPLKPTKTHLSPIPCVRLNEGRIDETISIIDFMERETDCDGSWYAENGIVQKHGGDFLTVRNTNSSLYHRVESLTIADSKAYVESSIEMLHFQMAVQEMISVTHWGRMDSKDISSISKFQQLIGDTRVDKECKDFRSSEYFHTDLMSAHFIACCMAASNTTTTEGFCEYMRNHQWIVFIRQVCQYLFDSIFQQHCRYDPETGEPKWKKSSRPAGTPAQEASGAASTRRLNRRVRTNDRMEEQSHIRWKSTTFPSTTLFYWLGTCWHTQIWCLRFDKVIQAG